MLKLVMAALLSLAVVGCDKTPEEKQKQALKDMAAYGAIGDKAELEATQITVQTDAQVNRKSLDKFSDSELVEFKAEYKKAQKLYKRAASAYAAVLNISAKKDDTNAYIANPEVLHRGITRCKLSSQIIQHNIDKIDEELAKKNRDSTRT